LLDAAVGATRENWATFTCPECGRTFTRAAALGAHRKMTHGVAGASKNAAGKQTNATAARKRRAPSATGRGRPTTAATIGGAQPVDRDALLRALFPAGIPPRQDVITQVNAWLDDGERLARNS
jgi:hypothetical protein